MIEQLTPRAAAVAAGVSLLVVVLAAGWWLRGPSLRVAADQVHTLTGGNPFKLRCHLLDRSQRVSYFTADSIAIVADLYDPGTGKAGPVVILLHGSYPSARRNPLIRILAERLRRKGYMVLAPDARAYGESADPRDRSVPEAFDFVADVSAAMDFLERTPGVDPGRIHLLGHSFGAAVAIAAESRDPRISSIVAKGPARRHYERIYGTDAPDRDYFMTRWAEDMGLPGPLDFDVWSRVRPYRDLLPEYLERFSALGHTPLFLIDAAEEDPRDLEWLSEVHAQMSPSVAYWTVPDAHHYLRTRRILRQPCHASGPVDEFVRRVDEWFREVS